MTCIIQDRSRLEPGIYRQCEMRAPDGAIHVGWIPERAARVGWRVTLPDTSDPAAWHRIVSVGASRLTAEQVDGLRAEQRHWKRDSSIGGA